MSSACGQDRAIADDHRRSYQKDVGLGTGIPSREEKIISVRRQRYRTARRRVLRFAK